jgi:TPR repeat protein
MNTLKAWLAAIAVICAQPVAAEDARYSISDDPKSISTYSSDANPQPAPRDPVAAARSAFGFFDYTVARRAWEPLAEQGHADAQYGLFQIYSQGLHVTPDLERAMRWLQLAARQGHPAAAFNLGLAYLRGEGVEQDLIQAWLWFSRAEQKKFASADRARASVERKLSADELAQARQKLNH